MKTIDKVSLAALRSGTTGIGSLPHHNVDAALDFSFKMSLPFLPQIPIRNAWEFMIPQALEGLPGLILGEGGTANLNLHVWQGQSHFLDRKLKNAFSGKTDFEAFEPSAATSSCWQPFLWELQERHHKIAKLQIAGPLTCQWALKLSEGSTPDRYPELCSQIFQLVLARSISMVRRMLAQEIQPVFFLDEPGLYALAPHNPQHLLGIRELKLMVQTLRKEGAIVGLHCCSDTVWTAVFGLEVDILSIDTSLSLAPALAADQGRALESFVEAGGRLSLGVIPTWPSRTTGAKAGSHPAELSSILHALNVQKIVDQTMALFSRYWEIRPDLTRRVLSEALYTPACGLALQSTSDVEIVLEKLQEVYDYFSQI